MCAWLKQSPYKRVKVAYFGPAYPPEDCRDLGPGVEVIPLTRSLVGWGEFTPTSMGRGDVVVVSATFRQGAVLETHDAFRMLDEYDPVARIGHTLRVYELTDAHLKPGR